MRKIYSILLALIVAMTVQAQTQDNAMYVYRNDGSFNAFLREDVDSITLSHFDLDSILHKEPICQVFHTPDSIYRIPIAAIDSVSFVQPETKYAPGVILLNEQYISYIVDVTENTITFSSSTPSELLPKEGNVLAAMVFEGPLSDGFAGKVVSVSQTTAGLTYQCEGVDLTDIYERLVYVGSVKTESNGSTNPNNLKRITANGSHSFCLGEIKGNMGPLWVSVTPTWTLSYVLFIEPEQEPNISFILFQDYNGSYGLDCKLDAGTDGHNIHWLPGEIRLNTPVAGLYGSVNWGLFYSSTASAQLTWSQDFNIGWNFGISQIGQSLQYINAVFPKMGEPSLSVSVNGEVNAGICVSFSLGFISNKIASIFANAYLGGYASAQFDAKALVGQYGTAYEGLKDSKVDVGIYAAGAPGYRLWFEKDKEIPIGLDFHKPLKSWYLLPDFTVPQIEKSNNRQTTVVKSNPSNDLVMPVQLGISIEDENGNIVETKWCSEDYHHEKDWPSNALLQQFEGLKSSKTYTAYPYVRILGHELKASPSIEFKMEEKELCPDSIHVHMIDLGLSVKWACCNVGANSPEKFGNYYAWGETSTKSKYTEDNSLTNEKSMGDIASTSNDVAHVRWGGSWRMPRKSEFGELVEKCSWEWTNVNGINGYRVTGPNGNSIFLPAAGYRYDTGGGDAGKYGYYWSSTPFESDPTHAYGLYFSSSFRAWDGGNWRFTGVTVRPVSK